MPADSAAEAIAGQGIVPTPVSVEASETGPVPSNSSAIQAIAGRGTVPPPVPTSAANMAPLTAAGVDLARRTMWMISGGIFILIVMLLYAEAGERRVNDLTNTQQLSLITANPRPLADRSLETVVTELRRAASDPKLTLSPGVAEDAKTLIAQALKNPLATDTQRGSLNGPCVPPPATDAKERAATLENCAAALETLVVPNGSMEQRVAFMERLQKSIGEERAAHRAFWLQVAQLVLINLLLPILTALLGYIFGTQQAQR